VISVTLHTEGSRVKSLDLTCGEILQLVEAASLPPDGPLVRQGWRTYEPALGQYNVWGPVFPFE